MRVLLFVCLLLACVGLSESLGMLLHALTGGMGGYGGYHQPMYGGYHQPMYGGYHGGYGGYHPYYGKK